MFHNRQQEQLAQNKPSCNIDRDSEDSLKSHRLKRRNTGPWVSELFLYICLLSREQNKTTEFFSWATVKASRIYPS